MLRVGLRQVGVRAMQTRVGFSAVRFASSKASNQNEQVADVSKMPLKTVPVLAKFYVPPELRTAPVLKWFGLLRRRVFLFLVNTMQVRRFKSETKLKVTFNDWKEEAIEKFVKTNKTFANACNAPVSKRSAIIEDGLRFSCGQFMEGILKARAARFPANYKLKWELVDVMTNPKIEGFYVIPDSNDAAALIQLVVNVTTKQKVTIQKPGNQIEEKETVSHDHLVYGLDPFSREMYFIGKLFPSGFDDAVHPDPDSSVAEQLAFSKKAADIFRSE